MYKTYSHHSHPLYFRSTGRNLIICKHLSFCQGYHGLFSVVKLLFSLTVKNKQIKKKEQAIQRTIKISDEHPSFIGFEFLAVTVTCVFAVIGTERHCC